MTPCRSDAFLPSALIKIRRVETQGDGVGRLWGPSESARCGLLAS
jgi:hypothetical protein